MKSLTIAFKDLKQSFRSAFALAFMFAVPLLVTGMFFLMFGNESNQPEGAFQPPETRLVVANLDLGDASLAAGLQASAPGGSIRSLGDALLASLAGAQLDDWLTVELVDSENAARARVDDGTADAALVIPADFSAGYTSGQGSAAALYTGAAQPAGVDIVKIVIQQTLDSFSGVRIAVDVAAPLLVTTGTDLSTASTQAAGQYMLAAAQAQNPSALLDLRYPAAEAKPAEAKSMVVQIAGLIMSGMLIFFAFFTGGSTAQSILTESEKGTLARLFTTPTSTAAILKGKYLSVLLTVLVQVVVLLTAAGLVFGIRWGEPAQVVLAAAGIITCAAAFGIFLTSLVKSTRQAGAIYGGLMTVTGMLGMMPVFAGDGGAVQIISLLTPQGWAVRGLTLSMNGAALYEVGLNLLVLLALSALLMGLGVLKFQRRFA